MKKLGAVLAVAWLSGCGGGVSPELYAVIVDFFRPATSCYTSGQYPNTSVTAASPGTLRVEVYDGADQKPFLEIVEGAQSVDMGDAPDVRLAGLLEGTTSQGTTTFVASRTLESNTTVLGQPMTVTETGKATVTFVRGPTWKGTLSLNSSRTCSGTPCPNAPPACNVDNVPLRGTRLQVEYQQAP